MVGNNIPYREDINAKDGWQEKEMLTQGTKRKLERLDELYKIRLDEKGRSQTMQSLRS